MKRIIMLLGILMSSALWAQEGMIVLAGKISILVRPPVGWIADTKSAASQGINVALYPEGQTWQSAPAVIYARAETKSGRTLTQVVASDEKKFRDHCSDIQIQPAEIQTDPQYPIQSRRFICTSGHAQNSEWVSYVDVGNYFVIWVASARKTSDLMKIQPAFDSVLRNLVVWDAKAK